MSWMAHSSPVRHGLECSARVKSTGAGSRCTWMISGPRRPGLARRLAFAFGGSLCTRDDLRRNPACARIRAVPVTRNRDGGARPAATLPLDLPEVRHPAHAGGAVSRNASVVAAQGRGVGVDRGNRVRWGSRLEPHLTQSPMVWLAYAGRCRGLHS